jgi:hypothetical protein
MDLDAEENLAMTNEAYKAWLDAMPIEDVRSRIERLELKLSDLRVFERMYAVRQPGGEAASVPIGEEASAEPSGEASAEPSGAEAPSEPADHHEASAESTEEEASPESGSQPT